MSTIRTDNDAKQAGGFLKSAFTIGFSRMSGDEVSRAVEKVSAQDLTLNEKHLARLVAATHGKYDSGAKEYENVDQYIMTAMEGKTHTRSFIVVMKALWVFHRFMHEGGQEINRLMENSVRHTFVTRNIKDLADSPDGAIQQEFILTYIVYIAERLITQGYARNNANVKITARMEQDTFEQKFLCLDEYQAIQLFQHLIWTLEKLCDIEFREATLNNHVSLGCFKMLIADSQRIYALLTRRMTHCLDEFSTYKQDAKQKWCELYKAYDKAIINLMAMYAKMMSMNVLWGVDIPKLRPMPDSVLERLERESDPSSPSAAAVEVVKLSDIGAEEEDAAAAAVRAQVGILQNDNNNEQSDSPAAAAAPAAGDQASPQQPQTNLFEQQEPEPEEKKPNALDSLFGGPADTASPNNTSTSPPPAADSSAPVKTSIDELFSGGGGGGGDSSAAAAVKPQPPGPAQPTAEQPPLPTGMTDLFDQPSSNSNADVVPVDTVNNNSTNNNNATAAPVAPPSPFDPFAAPKPKHILEEAKEREEAKAFDPFAAPSAESGAQQPQQQQQASQGGPIDFFAGGSGGDINKTADNKNENSNSTAGGKPADPFAALNFNQ